MAQKKLHNFLRKNWWITALLISSVTGIILSVIGFHEMFHVFSFYETARLFLLSVQFEECGRLLPCTLVIGRWFIFIAFVLFSFRIFIQIIAPKWWHSTKQYFPCSKRYLFVGAGEQAKILAKDLLDKPCRCIFLLPKEKENDDALFAELSDMRAIVLYANFKDKAMKFPHKIEKFFFVEEDENLNMEMSVRLLEQLKQLEIPAKEINIYVKTESEQFYLYIENELKATNKNCKNIEFHIFNQSDLTARLFVEKNPMLISPNIKIDHENLFVNGEFTVLFLGFGWQGQELLKKCVCDSQFVGSTFRATIIDKDFETLYGDYPVLFDECIKQYNLEFKTEIIGSEAFYEWIHAKIHNFNRIIIALGNDKITIDTAEKITKFLRKQGISNTKEIIFACTQQLKSYSNGFTTFGKLTEIYTEEMIVHEEMDIIAKHLHFQWADKAKYPTVEKAWLHDDSNILWNHDSSRAAAMSIGNILRLVGMKYVKDSEIKDGVVSEEQFKSIINPHIDILAENEHKRWNAYHFTKGIRLWKMDDIDYENLKKSDIKANQIKEYNRHAALIDFGKLPELDKIINAARERWNAENPKKPKKFENNQQTDRNFILEIPASLSKAKYVIIKNTEK